VLKNPRIAPCSKCRIFECQSYTNGRRRSVRWRPRQDADVASHGNRASLGAAFYFFKARIRGSELILRESTAPQGGRFAARDSSIAIGARENIFRRSFSDRVNSFGVRADRYLLTNVFLCETSANNGGASSTLRGTAQGGTECIQPQQWNRGRRNARWRTSCELIFAHKRQLRPCSRHRRSEEHSAGTRLKQSEGSCTLEA